MYAVLRLDGFADGPTLEAAAVRSTEVGKSMSEDVRWIRTYVLGEESNALVTVCIYEATNEDAIRWHAKDADLADTVIVRPDPA